MKGNQAYVVCPMLSITYNAGKKYFYLKDHSARTGQVLGNIRVTVDEAGSVKGCDDYPKDTPCGATR